MNDNPDSASMRLFVALPVPAAIQQRLAALPPLPGGGRGVNPADMHITLRFLGDVSPAQGEKVAAALESVRKKPFHVEIDGLDVFMHKDQNILYARVASTRNLLDLCARVTDRLTPLGFVFGTRPLVPHVTLARLKRHPPQDKALAAYIRRHGTGLSCRWPAADFALMQSGGVGAGAAGRYRLVQSYSLTP